MVTPTMTNQPAIIRLRRRTSAPLTAKLVTSLAVAVFAHLAPVLADATGEGTAEERQPPDAGEAAEGDRAAINARPPLEALATRPFAANEARGFGGMVTADNALASEVGAAVLREGGDAVDAAVATALMLGVVQPFASGIGGGGFAVVARHDGQRYTLDFREVAPAQAHRDMYLAADGTVLPDASRHGPLAVAVPGEVAGLFELHRRHGRLPWPRLVEPARAAASEGFAMHHLLRDTVTRSLPWLRSHPRLSQALLTPEGEPKPLGSLIRQPELAWTLRQIAERGAKGFYEGPVATAITQAMADAGGILTHDDLAAYQPKERPVLSGRYGPYELLTMPPPSSGGAVILQVLKAVEAAAVIPARQEPEAIHRLTEAIKHAFADRANLMGDPDAVDVPIAAMLAADRIAAIRAAFQPDATLDRKAYGGRYAVPPDSGTSHFNVVDAAGNAVALTTTINTTFGSRFVAGKSGVLLNNEMDDFVAKPGVPNTFGLIGREANAIDPGKRPLSSMSPTIILENGTVRGMVGGSGGPTIITGTLQVILNLIHQDASSGTIAAAVSAPRVHHQWTPDELVCDDDVPAATRQALQKKGHAVTSWPLGRFTSVQALWRYDAVSERGPLLIGGCDPSKLGRPSAAR